MPHSLYVVLELFNIHGKWLWSCWDGQLTKPYSSWTGLDLLSDQIVLSAHAFSSNRQLSLNQGKGKIDCSKYFMTIPNERMVSKYVKNNLFVLNINVIYESFNNGPLTFSIEICLILKANLHYFGVSLRTILVLQWSSMILGKDKDRQRHLKFGP